MNARPASYATVGHHRGASTALYHLITPANRLASVLPELGGGTVSHLLVTPRGRRTEFAQYHVAMPAGARSDPIPAGLEHFFYVLDGRLQVQADSASYVLDGPGTCLYLQASERCTLKTADTPLRMLWLKRRYVALDGVDQPTTFAARRDAVEAVPDSVAGASYRRLLPDDTAFDFEMNLLSFEPGTAFDQVEIHDEEHGIYMTAGEGVYLLDRDRHAVCRDDFMYLAPYCPQHFVALGTGLTEYLLYKPANRDGFSNTPPAC